MVTVTVTDAKHFLLVWHMRRTPAKYSSEKKMVHLFFSNLIHPVTGIWQARDDEDKICKLGTQPTTIHKPPASQKTPAPYGRWGWWSPPYRNNTNRLPLHQTGKMDRDWYNFWKSYFISICFVWEFLISLYMVIGARLDWFFFKGKNTLFFKKKNIFL